MPDFVIASIHKGGEELFHQYSVEPQKMVEQSSILPPRKGCQGRIYRRLASMRHEETKKAGLKSKLVIWDTCMVGGAMQGRLDRMRVGDERADPEEKGQKWLLFGGAQQFTAK